MKCGIVGLPNVGKSTLFNALTKAGIAAENYPFCTIEPNVGIVEVPDPRLDAHRRHRAAAESGAGDRRVRRHRRPGGRRVEGRGPGQQVPRQHPRDRRHRARRALLRGPERGARRRQGRPGVGHRDHQYRARARRPRRGREADRQVRQGGADHRRKGRRAAGRGAGEGAQGARCRAPCAQRRSVEGRACGPAAAFPADDEADDVRRQRGGEGLQGPARQGEGLRRQGAGAGGRRSARRSSRRSPTCPTRTRRCSSRTSAWRSPASTA